MSTSDALQSFPVGFLKVDTYLSTVILTETTKDQLLSSWSSTSLPSSSVATSQKLLDEVFYLMFVF
ncbi:hypothetical protein ATJ93_4724 [Halopiger aswanensis]|uniref:Uncharacterized protein n=1 Tax=Halopiger aswanensis TaxID=148449 RepID=A0A419VUV2_9EURY|nr:hypothetical protein ATJ93_4724 [Halopiger aswanensis]